jgi:hypothetical protein
MVAIGGGLWIGVGDIRGARGSLGYNRVEGLRDLRS